MLELLMNLRSLPVAVLPFANNLDFAGDKREC